MLSHTRLPSHNFADGFGADMIGAAAAEMDDLPNGGSRAWTGLDTSLRISDLKQLPLLDQGLPLSSSPSSAPQARHRLSSGIRPLARLPLATYADRIAQHTLKVQAASNSHGNGAGSSESKSALVALEESVLHLSLLRAEISHIASLHSRLKQEHQQLDLGLMDLQLRSKEMTSASQAELQHLEGEIAQVVEDARTAKRSSRRRSRNRRGSSDSSASEASDSGDDSDRSRRRTRGKGSSKSRQPREGKKDKDKDADAMETDDGDGSGKGRNVRRPRRPSGEGTQRKGFGPLPDNVPRRLELPVRIHYNRSGYAGWNAYMFAVKPPDGSMRSKLPLQNITVTVCFIGHRALRFWERKDITSDHKRKLVRYWCQQFCVPCQRFDNLGECMAVNFSPEGRSLVVKQRTWTGPRMFLVEDYDCYVGQFLEDKKVEFVNAPSIDNVDPALIKEADKLIDLYGLRDEFSRDQRLNPRYPMLKKSQCKGHDEPGLGNEVDLTVKRKRANKRKRGSESEEA